MQEVEGFLSGERNYLNLRGDTGPLVYPAGFLYVFAALRAITSEGENILLGMNRDRKALILLADLLINQDKAYLQLFTSALLL